MVHEPHNIKQCRFISCCRCRQAAKHKSCVDSLTCRADAEMYQAYLALKGIADTYMYLLCDNDTWSGCPDSFSELM